MSKNKYANHPPKSRNKERKSQPEREAQTKQPTVSASSDLMLMLPDLTYNEGDKSINDGVEEENVPMEYRAQIPGRCQRQYISDDSKGNDTKPIDVVTWAHEWSMASSDLPPVGASKPEGFSAIQTLEVDIQQRLVSNSGLDADLIRPVIGGNGWPVIPGSSIKGLFRRQCRILNEARLVRWCGNECGVEPSKQGILRFHNAYPGDRGWKEHNGDFLVDITHPQQKWQVGFQDKKHSAYAVISLRKPRLIVVVSSCDLSIDEDEWRDIKKILSQAFVSQGIGGRTCTGYGISGSLDPDDVLFECLLSGRGSAPTLLSRQTEFRTTMFRAAIRDMALRIFGGIASEAKALEEVEKLFGGIDGRSPTRSVLSCRFIDSSAPLIMKSKTDYVFDVFRASGRLQWTINDLRKPLSTNEVNNLKTLLECLHGLVMVLSGFGKGWRRIDHELFGASLREGNYKKAPIGCHWQWSEPSRLPDLLQVNSENDIRLLLHAAREAARKRLFSDSVDSVFASWQECIHPERMYIWTRFAESKSSSEAMQWFHAKMFINGERQRGGLADTLRLHRTELGGRLKNKKFNDGPTAVSRLWHRMFPLQFRTETQEKFDRYESRGSSAAAFQRASRGRNAMPISAHGDLKFWNGPYLETLVLFPLDQGGSFVKGAKEFIDELNSSATKSDSNFQRLDWK